MTESEMRLILKNTNGNFQSEDVPQLYCEIQTLRGREERAEGKQISFEDALYKWVDTVYTPIMNEVINNRVLKNAKGSLSSTELYFIIYEKAEQLSTFEGIKYCIDEYIKENSGPLDRFFSLFAA